MHAKDIPEFIFRGAVVAVNGREETIRDFSLQTPISWEPQCLYLEFKSGFAMEYDPAQVKHIPGRAPDFIRAGGHIFCKDPPSQNPAEDRFRLAANGEWEITHFHFEKDDEGQERLRLLLKRPWVPGKEGVLSRHFNARTMTPISDEDATPAPVVPVYELARDITVKKPIVLKRAP